MSVHLNRTRGRDRFCGYGYCEECGKECKVKAEVVSWDYNPPAGRNAVHIDGTDYLSECCDGHVYTDEDLGTEFEPEDMEEIYDGPDTIEESKGLW